MAEGKKMRVQSEFVYQNFQRVRGVEFPKKWHDNQRNQSSTKIQTRQVNYKRIKHQIAITNKN